MSKQRKAEQMLIRVMRVAEILAKAVDNQQRAVNPDELLENQAKKVQQSCDQHTKN